jgi:hypothetical protein
MNNDLVTSFIRTLVPVLVGWIIASATRIGLNLDSAELTAALTALFTLVYYTLVRWWESHNPKAGKLLGRAKAPTYEQ